MDGVFYPNAIRTGHNTTVTQWSRHNLGGEFNTLTGIIGRIDSSGANPGSITFVGDGRTLAAFVVDSNTRPANISVDVRGVSTLEIRAQLDASSANRAVIGFANATIQ